MVKKLLLIIVFVISTIGFNQSLEFGIGAKGNLNWLKGDDSFSTLTLDRTPYFDTVYFNFNETKMDMSFSIPLFLRFRTKFGFWSELSYSTEKLAANVSGTSNYSNEYLTDYTYFNMQNAYNNSNINMTLQEFYDTYFDIFYQAEEENWEEQVAYKEITKYHSLDLNLGYTFIRTKKIRPFASLGFTWNSRVHINHYQELNYETDWVNDYSNIYKKIPRMNSNLFFITVGGGIEMFNLQLGAQFRQSVGEIQEWEFNQYSDGSSSASSTLYNNISSFSFYLKYSLFNFNFRNKDDRNKLKNDELKVLGDFKEKNKLVKLGVGIGVPMYTNLRSYSDQYNANQDTIYQSVETPSMFLTENIFIGNYRNEIQVNPSNGQIDTQRVSTYIALGRLKRIHQLPKINFSIEIEPIKYFTYQTDIAYQYSEYDTEAKVLVIDFDWATNTQTEYMRTTVLRQSFNTISLGQKINLKYDVSPDIFIGINGGVNINFMIPGKFKFDEPGYNAHPLFEEFDRWFVRGETDKNWNIPSNDKPSVKFFK